MPLSHNNKGTQQSGAVFFLALLTGLVAALCYAQTLKYGFVSDDQFVIMGNPIVQNHDLTKIFLSRFWTTDVSSLYYRPLVILSYWIDFHLWGANPRGFHLTNIILNALISAMVFLAFRQWSGDLKIGFLTGLLFAVHPVHTQSVAWVSGRTDMLCTLFGLAAFWIYLRGRDADGRIGWKTISASAFCFLLAVLAKESAAIFPVLILASELIRPGARKFRLDRGQAVYYCAMAAVLLAYFLLRLKVLGFALGYGAQPANKWYWAGQTDVSRLVMVLKIYSYYFSTLAFPVNLSLDCKLHPSLSWSDHQIYMSGAIVLALIAIAAYSLRRLPTACLGILWFFIALLPVSNILPIHEIAMEHFLYLPGIGFCLLLSGTALEIYDRFSEAGNETVKSIVVGSLVLIIIFFGLMTVQRNPVWKNSLSIWKDAAMKAPLKNRAQFDLGVELYNQRDKQNAVFCFRRAFIADPDDIQAGYNLANTYLEMGRVDEAVAAYQELIRIHPDYFRARHNLGYALKQKGDLEGARAAFEGALKISPDFQPSLNNLAEVYLRLGQCDQARALARRSGSNLSPQFFNALQEKCPGL
jgi:protein O-mannosyl-transferase